VKIVSIEGCRKHNNWDRVFVGC